MTTKTAKTKTTKTAPVSAPVQDNQALILTAIKARIDSAPNENQRDNLETEYKFFSDNNGMIIINKVSHIIDIAALSRKISIIEKSNNDFVAVYALQKIRKMIYSIANNTKSFIDGYSNSIISNMVKLQEITNKSALIALSKSIEYTELDKVQEIKRTINVAVSTASTQASSTRQMLNILNIANITKRKNGDEFTFNDNETAKTIIAFYA